MDAERLLERFLRYVRVDTTAREGTDEYPSSPGQIELGKLIVGELQQLGIGEIQQDEFGIVTAIIPSNAGDDLPMVALNSHLDTSPETSGKNVQPQIIRDYQGGDLPLAGDSSKVITVAENPALEKLHGTTLITTDGTTLLGGDDKAGMAVMIETAAYLLENPDIPHGPLCLLFTCDEEIGKGVDHVDVPALGATVCYTLDSGGANVIDVETFSADMATVTIKGINIHPSIADGKMVNAIRVAGAFIDRLPKDQAPETTSDRKGFLHPYVIEGGVAEVTIRVLLRDFDSPQLEVYAELLRSIAAEVASDFPRSQIDVAVSQQYRNMGDGLKEEPRAVKYAVEAHKRLGREASLTCVRGGTDGSQFTAKGLPTPNLSTGQHNPHSPLEWACLDEMVQASEVLVELVKIWAGK